MSETDNDRQKFEPKLTFGFLRELSPIALKAFETELQKRIRSTTIEIQSDGTIGILISSRTDAAFVDLSQRELVTKLNTLLHELTNGEFSLPEFPDNNVYRLDPNQCRQYEQRVAEMLPSIGHVLRGRVASLLEKAELSEEPTRYEHIIVPSSVDLVQMKLNGLEATLDGKTGMLTVYVDQNQTYTIHPAVPTISSIDIPVAFGIRYGHKGGNSYVRKKLLGKNSSIIATPSKLAGCDVEKEAID